MLHLVRRGGVWDYFLFIFSLILFLLISKNLPAGVLGAGELDPTFDTDGLVQTPIDVSSVATGLALQPDGKLVAVGLTTLNNNDFAVVRYNSDGSLDNTFGTGGIVSTDFFGNNRSDSASSVLLLSNGKILVGGSAGGNNNDTDFALARYNPDGTLDTSFGTGGLMTLDFLGVGAIDGALSIALQSDGKIVAAGFTNMDVGVADDLFAIARFNADGSLDTGFGTNGRFTTDFGGGVASSSTARKVLVKPNGFILVGGDSDASGTSDLALLQLDEAGDPDANFGTNGEVLNDLGGGLELGRSIALLPNGQILQVGSSTFILVPSAEAALVRYNENGSTDMTFGTNGVVLEDFSTVGGTGGEGKALLLLADGKIVLGGEAFLNITVNPSLTTFALARYLSDGSPDPDFGTKGRVLTDFSNGAGSLDLLNDLILQPDGKIVAAGASDAGFNALQYALARYLGDTADLSIEKLADVVTAQSGQLITFTLTATNNGPDNAPGVMVDDEIPQGADFVSVNTPQGTCMVDGSILCDIGTLNVNESVAIILVLRANGSTSNITNTAVITGQVVDPDPENNTSTVTVSLSIVQGSGCQLGTTLPGAKVFGMGGLLLAALIFGILRTRTT